MFLGGWATEEEAARAHDRAVRFYLGPRGALNFPDEGLAPTDAATLRAEARREVKRRKSSRYFGVVWLKDQECWRVSITQAGQRRTIGQFANERAAAEAYDEESIRFRGALARVNFDPATGRQVWGKRLKDLTLPALDRRPRQRSARPKSP
jgi:AP2-like factor (ANT lineage)